MPKYYFGGQVTVSCYTLVDADSEEEAREIAENRNFLILPAASSMGWNPNEEWLISEIDGEPREITNEDINHEFLKEV